MKPSTIPSNLPPGEITRLLHAWRQGDQQAYEDLFVLTYPQIRMLAKRVLQRAGNHSLQPTEMVHEAFLELMRAGSVAWVDRTHFLAVAARAVRECLVDHLTRKSRLKRGGDQITVALTEEPGLAAMPIDLLALDQAMGRLRAKDDRQFRVVECRFFGGLTVAQTAEVLGVSPRSVDLDWSMARAWLFGQLSREA